MGKNLKLFSAEKEKFTKIFFKKILPRQKTPKKLPKTHRPMPKNNLCRQ